MSFKTIIYDNNVSPLEYKKGFMLNYIALLKAYLIEENLSPEFFLRLPEIKENLISCASNMFTYCSEHLRNGEHILKEWYLDDLEDIYHIISKNLKN